MSGCCAPPGRSAYATGTLPGGEPLAHPGGFTLTRRALEQADLPAGARVLDLGCGSGQTVQLLRSMGYRAMGIDTASTPGDSGLPCIRASAESLPLDRASFDAVLLECSLSVMNAPAQVLRECARVLVPGGRLLLSDLYARVPEAIHQVRALGRSCVAGMLVRAELLCWLREASFRVELWEDHSPALRTFLARFLMEGGTADQLWGCGAASADAIASAMRAVRAGYFLLIATRISGSGENP